MKNAVRVQVEANIMENVWGGFTQSGFAVLVTPKNQHTHHGNICPQCQVTDVTIRYDRVSHAGGGLQLATVISGNGKNGGSAKAGTRWSIHDIVMDDLSPNYNGGGSGIEIASGWPKNPLNNVTINHVTAFPDSGSHMILMGDPVTKPQMYAVTFTNNLIITGEGPVANSGNHTSCSKSGVPITALNKCITNYTFNTNGLIASPSNYPPSDWPKNNMFPQTVSDVDFADYNNGNGGNYELLSNSPYKNAGSDGKDLGADIVGLNQALSSVE